MPASLSTDILFINDDKLNNLICTRILNDIFPEKNVSTFSRPEEGLQYLIECETEHKKFVLFLDINMPKLNGWDILSEFAKVPETRLNQFSIYIISSSLNSIDRETAEAHPLVTAFVEKPLSIEKFREILT